MNAEAICLRIFPKALVRGLEEALGRYVRGAGKQIPQLWTESARQVLIKKQFHKATRRPTRAAYSKTARKSSASNSG